MRYLIHLDNDDAAECPDQPWAASLHAVGEDGPTEDLGEAGLGATPAEAIQALLGLLDGPDVDDLFAPLRSSAPVSGGVGV